jgi:hypothetical protein
MASHMTTFYEPEVTQVNETLLWKSSLDLMLMHHPHDEDFKLWEVRPHLEVEPFRIRYYHIFPNFRTLVIFLLIDLSFGDEHETI